MTTEAELLAQILADPRADEPRLVYADLLASRGDPRGELIQVQCAAARLPEDDPARAALDERAEDLLARHETLWTAELRALPSLDGFLSQLELRRGFVELARLGAHRVAELLPQVRARAPLRRLVIVARRVDELEALREVDALGALDELWVSMHPRPDAGGRALRGWPLGDGLRTIVLALGRDLEAVIDAPLAGLERLRLPALDDAGLAALAATPHLAGLVALQTWSATVTSLAPLARLTALVELEVVGGAIGPSGLAPEVLGRLRRLVLSRHRDRGAGAALIATHGQALERLELDSTIGRGGLARLVALPRLRHLVARSGNIDGDELAAAAPDLGRLVTLDLAFNRFGDAGARALAGAPAGLHALHLRGARLGRPGVAALVAGPIAAGLRALDVAASPIGDPGLAAIAELPALERLELEETGVTGAGIARLARSPAGARLRTLRIRRNPGALGAVLEAELPALRRLSAEGLDDAGAVLLAGAPGLPRLQRVDLTAPSLTDDGAEALARSPHLGEILQLTLRAPKLTDAGRAALVSRFGHHVTVTG